MQLRFPFNTHIREGDFWHGNNSVTSAWAIRWCVPILTKYICSGFKSAYNIMYEDHPLYSHVTRVPLPVPGHGPLRPDTEKTVRGYGQSGHPWTVTLTTPSQSEEYNLQKPPTLPIKLI